MEKEKNLNINKDEDINKKDLNSTDKDVNNGDLDDVSGGRTTTPPNHFVPSPHILD